MTLMAVMMTMMMMMMMMTMTFTMLLMLDQPCRHVPSRVPLYRNRVRVHDAAIFPRLYHLKTARKQPTQHVHSASRTATMTHCKYNSCVRQLLPRLLSHPPASGG